MDRGLFRMIFNKVLALASIVIAVMFVGVVSQTLEIAGNSVEVAASMDVMAGDSSTVGGLAAMFASSYVLSVVRIILWCVIAGLAIFVIVDFVRDGRWLYKKYFPKKEAEKTE